MSSSLLPGPLQTPRHRHTVRVDSNSKGTRRAMSRPGKIRMEAVAARHRSP